MLQCIQFLTASSSKKPESKKAAEFDIYKFKSWKSEDPLMKYIHENSLRLTLEQEKLLQVWEMSMVFNIRDRSVFLTRDGGAGDILWGINFSS